MAVVLNTRGLRFRGIYRAVFILPVVIPPIIVATVWRNMFDQEFGAITLFPSTKDITGVTIDGTHFENLIAKGIYAETLDGTTLFDNLTMDHVGEFGRGAMKTGKSFGELFA